MAGKGSSSVVPVDNWQVEDDLRTLCRAKEIQKDPKRLEKCKTLARSKMVDMATVAGEDKK